MTDPWSNPTGGSDLFSPSNHIGAVVLFSVRAFHPQLQGSFGARDAVECGVDIVVEPRNPAMTGKRFDTALVYGVALVDELRDKIGQHVLGSLRSKPSKNPQPVVVLEPATEYEQQQARDHVGRYGLASLQPVPPDALQQQNSQHAQAFQQGQQTGQWGGPVPGQQQQPQYAPQPGYQGGPPPGPPPPSQQPAQQQPGQQQPGQPAPWQNPTQSQEPPF